MKKLSMMIAGVLASTQLHALGLGDAQVHSFLGEPLQVSVPLHLSHAERQGIDTLNAQLADRAIHDRLGLDFREASGQILVAVQGDGRNYWLQLTTRSGVREPMLELPLDVRLGNTRLVRTITLLLDPAPAQPVTPISRPVRSPADTAAAEPAAPARATPPPATARDFQPRREGNRYGPIAVNQTLGDIANEIRPGEGTLYQVLVALWQHNPEAFLNNNMNRLMAGSTLTIPTQQEILAIAPAVARNEVVYQYQNPRRPGNALTTAAPTSEPETAPRPSPAREEPVATPQPVRPAEPAEVASEPTPPAPVEATERSEPHLALLAPSSLEQIPEAFRDEVQLLGERMRGLNDENTELRERIGDLEAHINTLSQQVILLAESSLALTAEESARLQERMDEPGAAEQLQEQLQQTRPSAGMERTAEEAPAAPLQLEGERPAWTSGLERASLMRYVLIGGALVLTLGIAGLWFRRLRERERYRDVMSRL